MNLAEQQTALVRALVAGGSAPAGFDEHRLRATAHALLRKRAGEVARAWPLLQAALAEQWLAEFSAWADGRPKTTSFADGYALAEYLETQERLPELAHRELLFARLDWRPGGTALTRRRFPLRIARTGALRALHVGSARHRWRVSSTR